MPDIASTFQRLSLFVLGLLANVWVQLWETRLHTSLQPQQLILVHWHLHRMFNQGIGCSTKDSCAGPGMALVLDGEYKCYLVVDAQLLRACNLESLQPCC
jgi:hypothetical protein